MQKTFYIQHLDLSYLRTVGSKWRIKGWTKRRWVSPSSRRDRNAHLYLSTPTLPAHPVLLPHWRQLRVQTQSKVVCRFSTNGRRRRRGKKNITAICFTSIGYLKNNWHMCWRQTVSVNLKNKNGSIVVVFRIKTPPTFWVDWQLFQPIVPLRGVGQRFQSTNQERVHWKETCYCVVFVLTY